ASELPNKLSRNPATVVSSQAFLASVGYHGGNLFHMIRDSTNRILARRTFAEAKSVTLFCTYVAIWSGVAPDILLTRSLVLTSLVACWRATTSGSGGGATYAAGVIPASTICW